MSGSAQAAPAVVSSLFTAADLISLRRDRLVVVSANYMPGVLLSDDYLMDKLLSAESELQHDMRVFFTPRQVLPQFATPDQIAAAQAANPTIPIIMEPGYDYSPGLFNGESWGLINLRQAPIISVGAITFNYPLPTDIAYTIPPEWVRADLKYGSINLVPVAANTTLPLNAYFLSVLGGGYTTPFLLQINYICGLANAKQDYPELLNLIKRLAVCMVIEDLFLPQSASTSVDGLSGSLSIETAKYREQIEQRTHKLRSQIAGVRMMVMG